MYVHSNSMHILLCTFQKMDMIEIQKTGPGLDWQHLLVFYPPIYILCLMVSCIKRQYLFSFICDLHWIMSEYFIKLLSFTSDRV